MKLTIFIVSLLMFAYALYALWSGTVVTTWARSVPRNTLMYWVVVLTFLIIPIGNFVMLLRMILKN